jgi:rRNA processing protein Gar1
MMTTANIVHVYNNYMLMVTTTNIVYNNYMLMMTTTNIVHVYNNYMLIVTTANIVIIIVYMYYISGCHH